MTRSDFVDPRPRRVLLVEHAESAPGVEQAEIVEILDHHHVGSIETKVRMTATFDPVGATATLVIERFRQDGMEPSPSSAMLLLAPSSPTRSSWTRRQPPSATGWRSSTWSACLRWTPPSSGTRCSSGRQTSPGCRRRRSSPVTSRSTRSGEAKRSRSRRSRWSVMSRKKQVTPHF